MVHNDHRTCETLTSNETVEIPVTSTCMSVVYFDSKNDRMILAYRISWKRYTPYTGDSRMLLHVYGKLTMAKSKSSRLSYNWVVSLPPTSMLNKTSKYEAEVDDSAVSLISSSIKIRIIINKIKFSVNFRHTSNITLSVDQEIITTYTRIQEFLKGGRVQHLALRMRQEKKVMAHVLLSNSRYGTIQTPLCSKPIGIERRAYQAYNLQPFTGWHLHISEQFLKMT